MKFFLMLMMATASLIASGAANMGKSTEIPEEYLGVWANADCELVQTGMFTLIFERNGDVIRSILLMSEISGDTLCGRYIGEYAFDSRSGKYERITFPAKAARVDMAECLSLSDGRLVCTLTGRRQELEPVERIELSRPREMPLADGANTAECLQQWQSGTIIYSLEPGNVNVQIGTNRHSYVWSENPHMVYCRAANIRHNQNGSLFRQTTRMMANAGTGEFTSYMHPDNVGELRRELVIDDSLFVPDACTFADDGIYWSLVEWHPETIILNGCGETYRFERPSPENSSHAEWFVYRPY